MIAPAAALALVSLAAADGAVVFLNVAEDQLAGEAATVRLRDQAKQRGEPVLADPRLLPAAEAPLETRGVAYVARPRAEALLRSAQEAYRSLELDAALQWQSEAVALLELDAAPNAKTFRLLSELFLVAGFAHEANGDRARALEAFRLSHRLDPERRRLDPATHLPSVVSLYAEAAKRDTRGAGALSVPVTPPDATVRLDGAEVEAGSELRVAGGEHYVTVEKPGFVPRTLRVSVRSGGVTSTPVSLTARDPSAELAALRSSAKEVSSAQYPPLARAAKLDGFSAAVFVREGPDGWTATRVDLTSDAPAAIVPAWVPGPASVTTTAGVATPWYKTGWGIGAIVGGVVVAGAATAYLLTRPSPEPTYSISRWCGASCAR